MIEAKPASPPNRPWPINSPIRPAPSNPANRPPVKPPKRPNMPPGAAAGLVGVAGRDACVGWVVERCIGAAVFGAVVVVGGALKVREPRLPKLPPELGRASTL